MPRAPLGPCRGRASMRMRGPEVDVCVVSPAQFLRARRAGWPGASTTVRDLVRCRGVHTIGRQVRLLRMAAAVLLLGASMWVPPAAASAAVHRTPGTAWTTYHANNARTG